MQETDIQQYNGGGGVNSLILNGKRSILQRYSLKYNEGNGSKKPTIQKGKHLIFPLLPSTMEWTDLWVTKAA